MPGQWTYWTDVPNAPGVLEDFPRECMFCGAVVDIRANEPICVEAYPHTHPDVRVLTVAHRTCFEERNRGGAPDWWK